MNILTFIDQVLDRHVTDVYHNQYIMSDNSRLHHIHSIDQNKYGPRSVSMAYRESLTHNKTMSICTFKQTSTSDCHNTAMYISRGPMRADSVFMQVRVIMYDMLYSVFVQDTKAQFL